MGLKLEENMYGWVDFFISGPYTLSCAKNTCKVYVTNVLYTLLKKDTAMENLKETVTIILQVDGGISDSHGETEG